MTLIWVSGTLFGVGMGLMLVAWHRAGVLTASRLSLVIALCVSMVSGLLFRLNARHLDAALRGAVASLILLPLTYFIARALARRRMR